MFKKKIIPLLTLIIILSCFKKSEGLKQSDMQFLINQVLTYHVQYGEIDETISKRIFNNYIESLDYGKYYFYKSDIAEFSKSELLFGDYIASGDYKIVFDIFKIYKERNDEAMKLFKELIKEKYDFTKDEFIVVDKDKVSFAENEADMRERWRKNIKLQLLNYVSSGKNIDEGKKKLEKKYDLMKKRVDEINDSKILDMFMNSITTALDPHSNYLSFEEHQDFKISMELKLEGIGVRLRSEDGFVRVESIITGGAADKLPETLQLKPNDKIVAVAQGKDEPVDVIDMELRDVVKLIRGEKGTEVRLTVLRDIETENQPSRFIVPIIREQIELKDSDAKSHIETLKNNGKSYKIGYIKLPSFYEDRESGKSSSGDVKNLLIDLNKEKVNVVILDLRGNPGGLLNEAITIAGFFIEQGPILQIVGRNTPPKIFYDNNPNVYYKEPLIILTDTFSASASEILAGAIKDYKRGLIIGSGNTYGKGTVQSYNELPRNLGAIKVTTNIFYQPSGTSNQLTGISPDVDVPDITAIWKMNENETKYPLKWKKIDSAKFKRYNYVNDTSVANLSKLSNTRTSKGEYADLKKKIDIYRKKLDAKSISLKEESEKTKMQEKDMEEKLKNDRTDKGVDLKNDLFLREAFNIGCDYYEVLNR
ncbi:MAG: carboxy terminal-processing peptidase [Leptospirales bacterium]|nr:carboxy terminal-processing peptidase [Leptospirales bacterium]